MVCRVALTGGIACGKSLAGEYLKSQGVPVVDADDVVHALLREDAELKSQIRDTFGPEVFQADGSVNRTALGQRVFGHPAYRKRLESWIHPKTRQALTAFFESNAQAPVVVAIIPLLFESGLAQGYDRVWLLDAPEEVQQQRLVEKRKLTLAEAQARIGSQFSGAEKRALTQQHPGGLILTNTDSPQRLYQMLQQQLDTIIAPSGRGN